MSQPSFMSKDSLVTFTVLVVDDDSTSLSIVSATLRSLKYDVVTVNSPVDALATIRIHDEIDLVITDLHMPKMNGLQLQKQIDEEFNLPVIIMSSNDRESVILKCLASGVVFYIVKPVNRADLKNVWQYAVGSSKGKSISMKELGCTEAAEKISDIASESSVNEGKRKKKGSKRKASKKGKECQGGENTVGPKKAKMVWINSLHARFLVAITHLTLEKAVPKKILEFMNVPGLTREHVASHLQKYRIFLKKVAEKGFDVASMNLYERALRSSFALGHSSLMLGSAQDYAQSRGKQQMGTSSFQAGYGGNMLALNATNFGSTGFSSCGASSSNSASQLGSLGNQQASFYQSVFGNTTPLYQANQATNGTGSNNIEADLLSRGGMTHGLDTNSKQMYQQKFQTWSDLYNISNNMGALSLDFGTSGWKPNFTSGYENMGTINNPYSTYAGIRPNDNVGVGQTNHNATVVNSGYGLLNGNGNEDVTAGLMGNAAFSYLAPGDSSSSAFDNANCQFPPAFAGANEEANPSVLPAFSLQQYGLGNNGQNSFIFDLMNNASAFGNVALPAEKFGEGTNMDDLLFDPTDFQLPYQQQGEENGLNPNFPNGSCQAELSLPTNQSQNPDLSNASGVEENAPWNELTLEQLQEIAEAVNADTGSHAYPLDAYYPNLDQNPNQQQGHENYFNSELNGLNKRKNSPSENQGGEDEFVDSLFRDVPY